MINRFILFIFIGLLLFQGGCASPPVLLNRVVVFNATGQKVTDVKILHLPTRKTGQVNAILPQKMLDIGFSGAPMLAHDAVISWKDMGGTQHEVSLLLPKDKVAAENGLIKELVYIIHPAGTVTVELH